MPDVRLLCAADLHLGRRPTRLPAGFDHSAATGWLDLVERAVADGVDAVLLAGDIVDQDNRYFEAYGPLEVGVRRLKEAGIALVAVAGNHDHATLYDVAAEVGQDHLLVLGGGGEWRRHTLRDAEGRALLHVDGWSFPEGRWAEDPTRGYEFEAPADGVPVVGLLHCDVDGREARYAPVAAATLEAAGPAAWVLGHVHAPEERGSGTVPLLYPGSLLALDPGEPGRHGAWLLEIGPGSPPRFRPIALSRVRYEAVEVDVGGVTDEAALRARVVTALRDRLDLVLEEGAGPLELLSCRVRLTGRTPLHARIGAALGRLEELDLPEREGVRLAVESRLDDATAPALDLADLARGSDPPALLARLLLAFGDNHGTGDGTGDGDAPDGGDGGSPGGGAPAGGGLRAADADLLADILGRARAAAEGVRERSHYAPVAGADEPSAVEARAALRRQASRLLDEMIRQKGVA